jgi:hypothetical protein
MIYTCIWRDPATHQLKVKTFSSDEDAMDQALLFSGVAIANDRVLVDFDWTEPVKWPHSPLVIG